MIFAIFNDRNKNLWIVDNVCSQFILGITDDCLHLLFVGTLYFECQKAEGLTTVYKFNEKLVKGLTRPQDIKTILRMNFKGPIPILQSS